MHGKAQLCHQMGLEAPLVPVLVTGRVPRLSDPVFSRLNGPRFPASGLRTSSRSVCVANCAPDANRARWLLPSFQAPLASSLPVSPSGRLAEPRCSPPVPTPQMRRRRLTGEVTCPGHRAGQGVGGGSLPLTSGTWAEGERAGLSSSSKTHIPACLWEPCQVLPKKRGHSAMAPGAPQGSALLPGPLSASVPGLPHMYHSDKVTESACKTCKSECNLLIYVSLMK